MKVTDDQIVDFIASFHGERGYPPSVRQIGEAVGLTSTSTVHARLHGLVRDGRLLLERGQPRTIRVARKAS